EGWFKSPKFTFEFDSQLEEISKIEALFKEIGKRHEDSDIKDEDKPSES
ncbi:MAG: Unknown protein, partial [uncultured Sulfurovum sp.]